MKFPRTPGLVEENERLRSVVANSSLVPDDSPAPEDTPYDFLSAHEAEVRLRIKCLPCVVATREVRVYLCEAMIVGS